MVREYLAGGNFSGNIEQAKHLQWGNMLNLESTINCEVLRSFRSYGKSSFEQKQFNNSERNKNLFYGVNVSCIATYSYTDTVGMSSIAIGPGLLFKYYTPIDLFFKTLIGFEIQKSKIWEPQPKSNTFFIPSSHSIGYKCELYLGYSLQLHNNLLFEPSISYMISKNNTYLPNDEKLYLPVNSVNIYLGFLMIIN